MSMLLATAVILASLSSPSPQTMPFSEVLQNIENLYGTPDPNPSVDLSGQLLILHKMEDLSSSFFDSKKFCNQFFAFYITTPIPEGLVQPFTSQFFYMTDTYQNRGNLNETEVQILQTTKNIVTNCGFKWDVIVNYFRSHN